MKRKTGVFATSSVDAHGDTFTREHLEQLVAESNKVWMPLVIEHDPRIEPVGRMTSARLITRADGVHLAEGEYEMFEEGDVIPLSDDDREIPLETLNPDQMLIHYDRPYAQSAERFALVKELADAAGAQTQQDFKKSQDPISVLTVATFVGGAIAAGFLSKLAGDAYELFKRKLKQLFASPDEKDRLLIFLFVTEREGVAINVQVILTNPTSEDIDTFLAAGTTLLQEAFEAHFDSSLGIRQMTYEYSARQLRLRFAVRKDAVPMLPRRRG